MQSMRPCRTYLWIRWRFYHGETIWGRFIGKLPLDIDIEKNADGGRPTTAFQPDSEIALDYREIGMKMTAKLSLKAKDHSSKFPNIVVQNT